MKFFSLTNTSVCVVLCAAGILPAMAQPDPSPAPALMQEMAGVYKHRFMSATIAPGKAPMEADEPYQAEDVVEIVPFDKDHIYVRARLNFYNGHSCGIAALARYEDGGFVYRDRAEAAPGLPQCVMRLGVDKGALTITDRIAPDGIRTCDKYCGARGTMNYSIGMGKRRPIRYMERLKASRQYRAAIAEMRAAQP